MQAYTLRTAAIAALMLAPAIAHAQPAAAARRAAAAPDGRGGYRLTMAELRRFGATMQAIGAAIRADPSLEARFTSDASESVEQIATRLGAVAQFRPAFARTGMTPRQFALAQFTLLGAGMALGAPSGGKTPEQLAVQMGIDPANVAFLRANQAAVQAMFRELGAGMRAGSSDETNDDEPAR